MTTSALDIQEREDGEVTVLSLSGQMTLDDGDLAFRRRVHDLVERGRTKIVVNLAGVTLIDSAGVGMMAAKLGTVKSKGGDMRLACMSGRANRVFGMVKLLMVFETFDDEAAAVKSFAWRG